MKAKNVIGTILISPAVIFFISTLIRPLVLIGEEWNRDTAIAILIMATMIWCAIIGTYLLVKQK